MSPLSTSKAGVAGGRGILEKAKGNSPCRLGGHLGIPGKGKEGGEGREREGWGNSQEGSKDTAAIPWRTVKGQIPRQTV